MNKNLKIIISICFLIVIYFSFVEPVRAGLNTDYVELEVTYKKSNGEACTADSDCSSDNCVDSYCCNTSCDGVCEACDISGSEGTCTNIAEDTDPDSECDLSCANGCADQTGDCNGAGACKKTYCPEGQACSDGSCGAGNYCNSGNQAYCSCEGAGCYNDGGYDYVCQGQCDGSGNCTYSANCSTPDEVPNKVGFSGGVGLENVGLDYDMPSPPFCSVSADYDSSATVDGDTVYCDADGDMWTETSSSTYAWNSSGSGSCAEACNYCNGLTYAGYSDWQLPTCTNDDNLPSSCQLYQFGVDNCDWDGGDGGQSSCTPAWDTNAASSYYWSSTEYDSNYAWVVNFNNGNVNPDRKYFNSYVRCVR